MVIRRPVLALVSAALLLSSSAFAQPKEAIRKLTNDEKKELQLISTALGAPSPPVNDVAMAWAGSDLLKAQGNKEYVPFTFTLDPSKLTAEKVSLYWRVSPATTCGADVPATDSKAPAQPYAYENLNTLTIPKGQSGPYRVSRSFVVCPGTYDV